MLDAARVSYPGPYFPALISIAFLLAPGASGVHAQSGSFENRPIQEIQFLPRQPLDAADLAKALPLVKGQPLHAADVAKSIDALFATGRFEDIVVEAEPGARGVIVRFVTQLAWFVGNVAIEGRIEAPPNNGQIESSTQLSLGAPFHEQDVSAAVDSIRALLKSNGFYNAEVTPEMQRDAQLQQVYITFTLREHKRAKYEIPAITGNTTLADATVVRATGWRIPIIHWWRQVTEARTSGGVRGVLSKLQKQQRLMATAEIQKLDYDQPRNRVKPSLGITPGPTVKVAAVEGKVSKRTLHQYVPVFQEHAVYNDLLVEGKRNLEDYFQSQGYYDAEVEFREHAPENGVVKIDYMVARGSRFKLVRLSIRGNQYFPRNTIEQRLFMHTAEFITLRHGRYSEAFRRKDEENVADLYRSNGFRDVKVSTQVQRNYRSKPQDVAVTMTIQEGPQWLVDNLSIEGGDPAHLAAVQSQLSSAAGEPFSEANLANDRNYALNYYNRLGYAAAAFQAAWQPSGVPHHVNVVYTINEGSREYVRRVTLAGLHTTRKDLVERTLRIETGDALSPQAQWEAQRRLYDLGVFARVDTAVEDPDGATDHKYVLYSFDEGNRYRLTVGLGLQSANFGTPSTTTLAAPGGTLGFSPEGSIDISRVNLWGLGHTVSLKGAYSELEKRASLTYLQPRFRGLRGVDMTYSLLFDNELDVRTFASKREEASVQVSDKFSKSLTGLVKFAYRRVSVSDVIIPVLLVPQFLQTVRIGMLSANFSQDRRNDPANPSHGMYNTVDAALASNFFGSQRSFGRVLLRNATYYKLTKNLILARQTRLGIIEPFSVPADLTADQSVPLPERFFGGGADSLRAFAYNQAGPRDTGASLVPGGPTSEATGFPLGGNALLFNNVELRFPLIGQNIQGVLFWDSGNIYTSLSDMSFRFHQQNLQDFNYMVHAPGFGIRYKTPVGPVRVDIAYAINPPSYMGFSGTPTQLLQCNPNLPPSQLPSYCQSTPQTLSHIQFFFSIGQTF